MPAFQIYTAESARRKVVLVIAGLAASKVRFFNAPYTVNVNSTKADLVAAEADYSGYPAGGYPLATWTGPINRLGGGAVMTSPTVMVTLTDPDPDPIVPGTVSGWWVEDATGNVRIAGMLDTPYSLNAVGDGFLWVIQIVEGFNPAIAFND